MLQPIVTFCYTLNACLSINYLICYKIAQKKRGSAEFFKFFFMKKSDYILLFVLISIGIGSFWIPGRIGGFALGFVSAILLFVSIGKYQHYQVIRRIENRVK